MKKNKIFILIMGIMFVALSLGAVTNTWNGSFNTYWHNNNNWSQGHIPLSTEDVVIPSGITRYPIVDYYDEECNSLAINSGMTVKIEDQTLTVDNDITVTGTLILDDTASKLYCNDITWASGSSASMVGSSTLYLDGTWEFQSGAEVFLDGGYVEFTGASVSYIRSKDDDSYFNNVRDSKTGSYLSNSGLSSQPLRINGNLYIYNNCGLQSVSANSFEIGGFINNMSGYIHLDHGTVEFVDGYSTNYFVAGDYFNNLTINSGATTYFDDPVEIKSDLTITSGVFDPKNNTVTIGGNWTNNVGDAGFTEGTGTVVFNGSAHQYCSNEVFNVLEVNKPSAAFRVNGTTVTCASYDWTSGAIDVLSGTFTANDLADGGIYGNWYLNTGGTINLYQDTGSGQYVDLDGNIHIFGGNFNVHGGLGDSYWPYGADASIEMSGGTLDFIDNGIYFYNSSSHTFSENITGGTIRTAGSITCTNANFTPEGGAIELYGSSDATINQSAGSIYDLLINKSATRNENDYAFNRYGSKIRLTRSNTVSLNSDLLIDYDMNIENGTFDLNGYSATINRHLDIYGTLRMNDAADNLTVKYDLFWKPGSSDDITAGNINCGYLYRYESGTNAALDSGSTLTFSNLYSATNYLSNQDSDATFGNVIANNASLKFDSSTQPVKVLGDFTVNAGKNVYLNEYSLDVDGTLDVENTANLSITSGSLSTGSDFNLTGDMSLDTGNVTINGAFDLDSTGSLTINGGNFSALGSYINDIYGSFTMTDGTYQVTESCFIEPTATTSISGGIMNVEILHAHGSSNFQPTDGIVNLTLPGGSGGITCDNGNFFHNLQIDGFYALGNDLQVNNDLTISSGYLDINGHSLTVNNNMDIYSTLTMTNAADQLTVKEGLSWKSGSSDNITAGNINSGHFYRYESGTNAALDTGSTLTFENLGSATSFMINQDSDATFGNVIDNNTSLLYSTSTQPVKVLGDFTVNAGKNVYLGSFSLDVDGTLDVKNTASLSITSGSLTNGSDLNLAGDMSLDTGNVTINGAFDLASTGSLTINGGNFIATGSTGLNNIYGSFTMSGGTYQVDESCFIKSGATTSISGGEIYANVLIANIASNFQPTGGKVILRTSGGGTANITCNNGNYFHDLEIDRNAQLADDLQVNNDLTISSGYLDINGHSLTVNDNMDIYDTLTMTNAADHLTVKNGLSWKSGSSDNITAGNINSGYLYRYESGTNAALDTGSTLTFSNLGSATSIMINQDSDATFGNVIANNTSLVFNSSNETVKVLGDFTVNAGKNVRLTSYFLDIDGTLDVENTGSLSITSGSLTNGSDLNLTGDMSLDTGNVTINGAFDLASTASLTINGGNFSALGSYINDIYGSFTMSDGTYQVTESCFIEPTATTAISGGVMNVEILYAHGSSNFQPTGGIVNLNLPGGSGNITCDNGNFFHNLQIDGSYALYSDLQVNNDLTISSGYLNINGHTLSVDKNVTVNGTLKMNNAADLINAGTDNNDDFVWGNGSTADITAGTINNYGNWNFESGCNANLTGGTVNFVGATNAVISNLESTNSSFYNLTSNKGSGNYLTFNSAHNSYNLHISNDLTNTTGIFYLDFGQIYVEGNIAVNADELRLGENTTLRVGTALDINNTATLNAVATSGNETLITATTPTGYYDFNVNSGGTISTEYVTFERMTTQGLYIKAGGAIDPSYPMNYCTFKDGETSGNLLTIDNDQTVTIDNATFIAGSSKDATYNVAKTVDTGSVTFTNAIGSYAGPDYENDTYSRIDWSGFAPDLAITDVGYSDTNPYLADLVTVTVVVKNQGNAKIYSTQNFYVDYFYNPGAEPVIGDVGDTYREIYREIAPDDTIHVILNISNDVAESWNSYLIVDTDELITELNETNNIVGPYALTWQALPTVSNINITLNGSDAELTWNYPISADSYKIYKTTAPYDYSGATTYTSNIKRYTDSGVTSNDRYFYVVTAVRNYPPAAKVTREMQERRKEINNRK